MANSATTHVGGAEGFAAKTLGFALKKNYYYLGPSQAVLHLLWKQDKRCQNFHLKVLDLCWLEVGDTTIFNVNTILIIIEKSITNIDYKMITF